MMLSFLTDIFHRISHLAALVNSILFLFDLLSPVIDSSLLWQLCYSLYLHSPLHFQTLTTRCRLDRFQRTTWKVCPARTLSLVT